MLDNNTGGAAPENGGNDTAPSLWDIAESYESENQPVDTPVESAPVEASEQVEETPTAETVESIFADDEPAATETPAVEAEAEPFDTEAFLAELDDAAKLDGLKPEQFPTVTRELFQRYQVAAQAQQLAQQIEEKTGLGMEFVPDVLDFATPLLYGKNPYDPATQMTGVAAFMNRLWEFGADANDASGATGLKKGELYTTLLSEMLGVELNHLDQMQPSEGQLPVLVDLAYKPVLKHVLGVEPTPELVEQLRTVAKFGLPAQAAEQPVTEDVRKATEATLALVDQSLHQYWKDLTPSQKKYLVLQDTDPSEVTEALQAAKEKREFRQIAEQMKAEKERTAQEQAQRVEREAEERAVNAKLTELDDVIAKGGRLFKDEQMEAWKNAQIKTAILREFQDGGRHAAVWQEYIKWQKAGNPIHAKNFGTKVTQLARQMYQAEVANWNRIKTPTAKPPATTPKPATAPTRTGTATPQFTPANGDEDERTSLVEIANQMFGRA